MMTLRDLINKLLGRETSSANTARERLQLVLAHDRVDMSSLTTCLLYTSPSPRDATLSRMPSSA